MKTSNSAELKTKLVVIRGSKKQPEVPSNRMEAAAFCIGHALAHLGEVEALKL